MNVLIVGGFLGSGKTTFILKIAKKIIKTGKKVVVIVNEIGEMGIDTEIIEYGGFNSVNLEGGCICCTLKYDMMRSVHEISSKINPDYLIVEPTGVALIGQTRSMLSKINIPFIFLPLITLVDPTRFKTMQKESKQFTEYQIKDANILAITKCDLMDYDEISSLRSEISIMNPNAVIKEISKYDEFTIDWLWDFIISEKENFIQSGSIKNSIVFSNISSCSGEFELKGPVFIKSSEKLLKNIMEACSKSLSLYNSSFIGHIKMSISFPSGLVKISKTSSKDQSQIEYIKNEKTNDSNELPKLSYVVAVTNIPKKILCNVIESACCLFLETSYLEYKMKKN